MVDFARLQAHYAAAADLLQNPGASVHFVGIGGVGMAGLARLLRGADYRVSGCDFSATSPYRPWLESSGIPCSTGHSPDHLAGVDAVVRTAAAPLSLPEIRQAPRLLDRGCLLAALFDRFPATIAVCGTHGKTTTASFTATLLQQAGLRPGWCIGGTCASLGDVLASPPGGPDAPFVAECDESDGTLSLYHPLVTVITSTEFDHAEHYSGPDEFRSVFATVARQTRGTLVYHEDVAASLPPFGSHPSLPPSGWLHSLPPSGRGVAEGRGENAISFGFSPSARLRATNVSGTSFDIVFDGAPLGRYTLPVPGRHNILNFLAATGALLALGINPHTASLLKGSRKAGDNGVRGNVFPVVRPEGPQGVRGNVFPVVTLPARRFETVSTAGGVRVVIDYAHHPTEIAAAITMARETLSPGGRLLGVFQPHRYSRTKALGPAFPAAFSGLDALALAPVYAASEPPLPGGDTADLYAHCRTASSCGEALAPCFLPTLSSALTWLRFTACPGDTVLLIGAGDIISLVPALQRGILRSGSHARETAPSSYGVGGPVHSLARVTDPADLPPLLASCRASGLPWRVIGAGTNLLVSDAGWEGVLIRLEGPAFQSLDIASDGTTRVGAGLPGARLLHEWTARGLSGLECMDGIPGTLGGWLAMNAGAQGHAIGDCLVSLTLLAPDGTVRTLPRADLDLSYRHASFTARSFCGTQLAACVILSATFAPLARTTPSAVEAARAAFRAKRFDFSGLRTAGSVFRNPPGDSAGRILDAAGLKGLRIGGAEVSPRHANIFVAHPGATASDLFALIRLAQLRSPVPLEPEITLL